MLRAIRLPASCCLLLTLTIALILPGSLWAEEPEDAPAVSADPAPAAVPLTEAGRFDLAVAQSDDAFHQELARLTELYAAAATAAEAAGVQKQITALKQGWEIELFEIQLDFAREAGRTEQVEQLQAIIKQAREGLVDESPSAGR